MELQTTYLYEHRKKASHKECHTVIAEYKAFELNAKLDKCMVMKISQKGA
jgi:hypothetical protein